MCLRPSSPKPPHDSSSAWDPNVPLPCSPPIQSLLLLQVAISSWNILFCAEHPPSPPTPEIFILGRFSPRHTLKHRPPTCRYLGPLPDILMLDCGTRTKDPCVYKYSQYIRMERPKEHHWQTSAHLSSALEIAQFSILGPPLFYIMSEIELLLIATHWENELIDEGKWAPSWYVIFFRMKNKA